MQWLAACRYIINSTKVFITKLAATARLLLLLLALSSFEKKKTKVCCCLLCKDKTENHVWPCLSSGQQWWSNEKDIPSLVLTVAPLQQHLILHSLWKQSQLALEKEEEEHRFTWIVARSPKGPQETFYLCLSHPLLFFYFLFLCPPIFLAEKGKKKKEIKDSPHFLLAINQQIIGPL